METAICVNLARTVGIFQIAPKWAAIIRNIKLIFTTQSYSTFTRLCFDLSLPFSILVTLSFLICLPPPLSLPFHPPFESGSLPAGTLTQKAKAFLVGEWSVQPLINSATHLFLSLNNVYKLCFSFRHSSGKPK